MKNLLKSILLVPGLGYPFLLAYRLRLGSRPILRRIGYLLRWLIVSRETTNFTYPLSKANIDYLSSFLAVVTGCDRSVIAGYISEVRDDESLKEHIIRKTRESSRRAISDSTCYYGRRMGWYAVVRSVKPKIVVETGVDKGMGACIICSALARNAEEGHPGKYYGTDINPEAGYLLSGKYAQHGQILFGDSVESLTGLPETIDVFINDSDHSAEYEEAEYRAVEDKLARDALIIGDNAEVTTKLYEYAEESGRQFLYWAEKPERFWNDGGGIGVAWDLGERASKS